jgi:hypothetical protein
VIGFLSSRPFDSGGTHSLAGEGVHTVHTAQYTRHTVYVLGEIGGYRGR